jgi:hypothetical protein
MHKDFPEFRIFQAQTVVALIPPLETKKERSLARPPFDCFEVLDFD